MSQYKAGDRLRDKDPRSAGRIVELVERVNPQGPTAPYWKVRRIDSAGTGTVSTIREDRLPGAYATYEEETQ